MTAPVSVLYGLRVSTDLPLHQHRPAVEDGAPDIEIGMGHPIAPTDDEPPGSVLAHLRTDRNCYTFTRTDDGGHLLRFYGTCDFAVDPSLSRVRVHLVRDADRGLAGVLAAGALLAFLLTMRGIPVLHASAVQVGETALAFAGRSGMGKSTMAALLCAAGARLVTDDVLRVDLDAQAARCRLGATELRIRKAAGDLAGRFVRVPSLRPTSDGRHALQPRISGHEGLPLRALVIPVPDHGRRSVEVTRMPAMDALLAMLCFPRIVGWRDRTVLEQQFRHLGELAERVPVFLARVPWGPPFARDTVPALLAAVGCPGPDQWAPW